MQQQTKTSTSFLLFSSLVLIIVLITSPLGYQYGLVPLQPSLVGLMIAFVGSSILVAVGAVLLIRAVRASLGADRNLLAIAIFLGLLPLVILLPHLSKALSLPMINDISTDTVNPPKFVDSVPRRVGSTNSVAYGGSGSWSADKLAAVTRSAYPDLKTQSTSISFSEAVHRSKLILEDMGLEIIVSDIDLGRVEATATSFWFGFKDDLVVRVAENEGRVMIDLRSKSRVGQADFGSNAERIREFIRRF